MLPINKYANGVWKIFNTYGELKNYCQEEKVMFLDFKVVDIVGKWRHLTMPVSQLTEGLFENGFGFDGSNYGYANIENSDMVFVPDLTTAFKDPFWQKNTLGFMGSVFKIIPTGLESSIQDPRNILIRALKLLKAKGIADEFIIGPEFEFYIFDGIEYHSGDNSSYYKVHSRQAGWGEDPLIKQGYSIEKKDGYHLDCPGDTYRDLRNDMVLALEENNIPVKYHHHEVGAPGQQEIEISLGEASKLADYTMLIKYLIKNIAYKNGKTATFMPKPLHGEAGNGFHVHMQLFKEGKSQFAGPAENFAGLSDKALYFMGGILKHSSSIMGLVSPSTNSYKRLVEGYEAPVLICFANMNRSAVVRVPGYAKSPEERRFEFRPPDFSGNPYLTYAALLLAGIDGIEKKVDPIKEGYGPLNKNVYCLSEEDKKALRSLPKSFREALNELEKDNGYLVAEGVFHQSFLDNWLRKKRMEIRNIEEYPHPREFDLYYDL